MTQQVVTRAEAKRAGMTYYFTGDPCARGHIAKRRVKNYTCVRCQKTKHKDALVKYLGFCKVCGTVCPVVGWVTCSVSCREQWQHIKVNEYAKITAALLPPLFCKTCGAQIKGNRNRKYCSPECVRAKAAATAAEKEIAACAECGLQFVKSNANSKYCSNNCRATGGERTNKSWYWKNREDIRQRWRDNLLSDRESARAKFRAVKSSICAAVQVAQEMGIYQTSRRKAVNPRPAPTIDTIRRRNKSGENLWQRVRTANPTLSGEQIVLLFWDLWNVERLEMRRRRRRAVGAQEDKAKRRQRDREHYAIYVAFKAEGLIQSERKRG